MTAPWGIAVAAVLMSLKVAKGGPQCSFRSTPQQVRAKNTVNLRELINTNCGPKGREW
jgi:hypothetical protein